MNFPKFYHYYGMQPKTQKGRGILFLQKNEHRIIAAGFRTNNHTFYKCDEEGKEEFVTDYHDFPVFIRPMPVVPRHGFVDSRPAYTPDFALTVFDETFRVEPEAEIGVAKPIECDASAIMSNGSLIIGASNDGATSGTSDVVRIPVSGYSIVPDLKIPEDIIGPGEAPFWEILYPHGSWTKPYVVQLRSGPRIGEDPNKNWIPKTTTVKRVFRAKGDLLEWEQKIKNAKEGDVVDATGQSLVSHYCIHAVVNNIPVFIEETPKVGITYEKTTDSGGMAFGKEEAEELKLGFASAFKPDAGDPEVTAKALAVLGLTIHHNMKSALDSRDFRLIGYAMGAFSRITFVLAAGELRYHSDVKKEQGSKSRNEVYEDALGYSLKKWNSYIQKMYELFMDGSWSSSYGGSAWAGVLEGGVLVMNAVASGNIKRAVEELNKAVHNAHNGGWFLNKILPSNTMDFAAKNPAGFAVYYGRYLYKILTATIWDGDPNGVMDIDYENPSEINPVLFSDEDDYDDDDEDIPVAADDVMNKIIKSLKIEDVFWAKIPYGGYSLFSYDKQVVINCKIKGIDEPTKIKMSVSNVTKYGLGLLYSQGEVTLKKVGGRVYVSGTQRIFTYMARVEKAVKDNKIVQKIIKETSPAFGE